MAKKEKRTVTHHALGSDQDLNLEELFALVENEGMSLEEVRTLLKNNDRWLHELSNGLTSEEQPQQPPH